MEQKREKAVRNQRVLVEAKLDELLDGVNG